MAETQVDELPIKVEKHYLPLYELVVSMPEFVSVDQEFIEASVDGAFVTERIAYGNTTVRWMVKKIDFQTPMFNDSDIYRQATCSDGNVENGMLTSSF